MSPPTPQRPIDEQAALRAVVEGTAAETGQGFFAALVQNLARALGTSGAWVTEYVEEQHRLRALAFWLDGRWVSDFEYGLAGTPCAPVVEEKRLFLVPERVVELYRTDDSLKEAGAVSYMGVPLLDLERRVLGHLAVLDRRPMPEDERCLNLFQIFANRAAAEMLRLRAEARLREREEKLQRLVGSAMDAIVEMDGELRITLMNAAAEKAFGRDAREMRGRPAAELLAAAGRGRLETLAADLARRPEGERFLWIPGGLQARRTDGGGFPAEGSFSRFEAGGAPYYTLILRNVDERLEAERRIHTLTAETEYLKEELRDEGQFGEILGHSPALGAALREVGQVAATDAAVLILGETGTGKELVARAIHDASPRREHPLIKVNCAAIPAALIESEFFGHERGAFTGATQRREGRFALADRGTIFLDEVGELPLELQGKLLRVLQEGEFERVGSSQTQRVDVRVIAATNRDLQAAVRQGSFREDLYYRLSVFPLRLPPLRERGDDVVLLAREFADRLARRMGRRPAPLSAECAARLRAYSWPGNVRELQNVIERAVITAVGDRLNLDRALPEAHSTPQPAAPAGREEAEAQGAGAAGGPIRTAGELQELERENLRRALEKCGWRVAGEQGAARLLGMKPSTLSSRIKALGIRKPGA